MAHYRAGEKGRGRRRGRGRGRRRGRRRRRRRRRRKEGGEGGEGGGGGRKEGKEGKEEEETSGGFAAPCVTQQSSNDKGRDLPILYILKHCRVGVREGEEEQPINVLFVVRAPLFTSRVEVHSL